MAEKDNSKSTAKPAAKSTAKAAPKAEAKPAAKSTAKAAPKAEAKPAAKSTAKAAPKAEAKPAAKSTAKAAPKAEVKPAAKSTAKAAPKAEPKSEAKVAPPDKKKAPAAKVESKTNTEKDTASAKVNKKSVTKTAEADIHGKDSKPAEDVKTKSAKKNSSESKTDRRENAVAADIVELEKSKKSEKPVKEKPEREEKEVKKESRPSYDGEVSRKQMAIVLAVIAGVIIVTLILGIALGVKSCSNFSKTFRYEYTNASVVGFSSKTLGETDRYKPVKEIKNEGLPAYPKYGYTLKEVLGEENAYRRDELIYESSYLTATGTWNGGKGGFTWMDEEGRLYSGTRANPQPTLGKDGVQRQLYQHTVSVGMYFGDVSDNEPGVIKEVTMRPRQYTRGYNVTGVYAPAGEVIKIEISEADMEATGGVVVHIGQALYNGKANNIWTAKGQMQRFPVILNTMTVSKDTAVLENGVYTAYVGSFVGGPIYIRNETVTFTATISGAVNYSHFILGYTTEEEFEENSKSSAPYFDLEVWDNGVLHSGPKEYAKQFSYEDIYKAAVLWEKVSLVSTTGSPQGIVFLYDPFVAAGAAVAFPGQGSVNCPADWMRNSLNYKGIVNSGGWGNFHEYHHNFQGYGVGNGGEVTNNGMTLVSYSQFTKISSARGIDSYGAAGLGGWNSYTSATWALEEVLKIARPGVSPSNGNMGLSIYATLLHNFGADNYIQAKYRQRSAGYGEYYVGYLKAWQDITHNDMTYFFKDVLQGISEKDAAKLTNSDYSMFVPVSSVYQTGRSYKYDGETRYFKTMQPYAIKYNTPFEVDLRPYTLEDGMYKHGSIVLPDGFSFKIKNVTSPEFGKIEAKEDGLYTFIPDKNHLHSGKILVTLEITKDDGAFKVDDVDLVLEFEQSHEMNKSVLERTTYTYSADKMYKDAEQAYANNYAGYASKEEGDNINPVQNSNTDIWYYPKNYQDQSSPHIVPDNAVAEVKGKLYFKDAGKYRIYLRGRTNCAMYYSTEGDVPEKYKLGGVIKNANGSANFYLSDSKTYVDLELGENSWVYFKTVLIVETTPIVSFVGLGMSQWTDPMFTIQEDEDGKLHYYDYQGHEVSEAEANNAEKIPPIPKGQPYVNAYRSTYEMPHGDFESEYMYTRKYNYNYNGDIVIVSEGKKQTSTADCNYIPWKGLEAQNSIDNLFDGDPNTGINFDKRWGVSETNPAILAFDLGEVIKANAMTLYTNIKTNGNDKGFPKDFKLEGSINGTDYFDMGSWTNQGQPAVSRQYLLKDGKDYEFRYYRLTITKSGGNTRCALAELQFSYRLRLAGDGNNLFSPDNEKFVFDKKWSAQQAHSTFGHVYLGKSGAKMKFEFEGTRFAILSSAEFGYKFEVKIDGKEVPSIAVKSMDGKYGVTYICPKLSSGKHKVEIKCKGKANIDSIAIYDEDKVK